MRNALMGSAECLSGCHARLAPRGAQPMRAVHGYLARPRCETGPGRSLIEAPAFALMPEQNVKISTRPC